MKQNMRQQASMASQSQTSQTSQTPQTSQYQVPPLHSTKDNFQTYHQPVNFNQPIPIGTPSHLIQQKDPRDVIAPVVIKKNESVKEVLKRLHSRESGVDTVDTMEETTTNNDRLVSDTMSDTKKKKKNLMVVT
jgi:hypothetical protein